MVAKVLFSRSAQKDNTVNVVFEGDTATVSVAENITDYVTVKIDGAPSKFRQPYHKVG